MTCPQPYIKKNLKKALEKQEEIVKEMYDAHKKYVHFPSEALSLHTDFAYYYTGDVSNSHIITNTVKTGLKRVLHRLPSAEVHDTSKLVERVTMAFSEISKADKHTLMMSMIAKTVPGLYDNKDCFYSSVAVVMYYNFPSTDYDTEHDLTLVGYWIYLFMRNREGDSPAQDGKHGEAEADSTYMIVDGSRKILHNL